MLVVTGLSVPHAQSDVGLMTKEELKAGMDDEGLVNLDVCRGKDWTSSEFKIKGALHADPGKYDDWSGRYAKSQKIVLYCA